MLGEIADIVEMMPKARRKREFDIRNNYYLWEGDSGNKFIRSRVTKMMLLIVLEANRYNWEMSLWWYLPFVAVLLLKSHAWLFVTPGSSVLGILQAGTLEWVAISFSRGSSRPRDWKMADGFFTTESPGKP